MVDFAQATQMSDVVNRQTRSRMMAGIRSRDTKPEITLRTALHSLGFRYRLHVRKLPGKPDIVLPKYHAVIFVHGCFWHRHQGCKYTATPATRANFWAQKFRDNMERDARNIHALQEANWRVKVVWECELRESMLKNTVDEVVEWLTGDNSLP